MPTYDNPPPPHRRSWPKGGDRDHTWVPGDPTTGPGKLAGYSPVGDNDEMCIRYRALKKVNVNKYYNIKSMNYTYMT